jgi:hypothetical protein
MRVIGVHICNTIWFQNREIAPSAPKSFTRLPGESAADAAFRDSREAKAWGLYLARERMARGIGLDGRRDSPAVTVADILAGEAELAAQPSARPLTALERLQQQQQQPPQQPQQQPPRLPAPQPQPQTRPRRRDRRN